MRVIVRRRSIMRGGGGRKGSWVREGGGAGKKGRKGRDRGEGL